MTEAKTSGFNPNYAVPPGSILEEWLEEHGMTQSALAARMGRPIKTINEIIKGKTAIMQETALQLESVTGVEATFWTNADRLYQERAARLAEEAQFGEWAEWASSFPVREMVKHGWVQMEKGLAAAARVRTLLRHLGVATPDAWNTMYVEVQTAYRTSPAFKSDPAHLGVWLRQGEIQAQRIECQPYSEAKFKEALKSIRNLTAEDVENACEKAVELCRAAGVALVFVPELSQTRVSGATRWLSPAKAIIQISLRYKTDDQMWFTFIHEAAHILFHGKRETFVEFNHRDDPREKEADSWAADFLIPPVKWREFVSGGSLSVPDIRAFAKAIGIAPGIVVGRLQYEKIIPFAACNQLKRRLQFKNCA